jgi:potassium efflux system protein
MTEWLNVLTKRAAGLQDALNHLAKLQGLWTRTRDEAQTSKVPAPILQQIGETLAAIEAAQTPLRTQLSAVLDIQGRVAAKVATSQTALARIAAIQQSAVKGIFVRDSQLIWSFELWANGLNTLPERVLKIAAQYWSDIMQYIRDPSQRMPLHVGFFVGLSILFYVAGRTFRRWTATSELESTAVHVFDHAFAAALTVSLIAVTSPLSQTPTSVKEMFQLLSLVPMIILVRPLIAAQMVSGLYVLGLLFAVDTVRQTFAGAPLIGQAILVFDSLAGIAAAILFLGKLRKSTTGLIHSQALRRVSGLFLLLFSAGLAASALGYMRLARLLTPGILSGGVLALELYASICVISSLVAFSFRVWPLKLLGMVRHNRHLLERWVYRLLVWFAIIGWVVRYLNYLGLLEPAFSNGKALLGTEFHHGAISFSLGDILDFFITVWAAYLLSAFIRFVLREDVYPRISISPGKSYAVSSLLHYLILSLGVIAGIGVLGINLTKLTVLTGAFGVGIGFGMQSVVNNFISGLILLFERPVQVGDTLEVGDLLGKVRHIGIRSSTVHTRQGADIIVPNSQLITEKVTNWTLSDMLRRIDLPVGVNYSAIPANVIKVLEGVALAHPQILRDPAPQALFMGYGDSSINFELRAWTAQFDTWQTIRSDLAVATYDAVHAAGMSFPFPQREVRLLRDADQGPGAAAIGSDSVA